MSKSLGNGIDPLEVIDKYGADTLRFTLSTGNAPGNDMRFYWEKVEASRNFANKIWNASRFVMMNLEDFVPDKIDVTELSLKDRWILKRVNDVTREVTDSLDKFEIGIAAQKIYDFFWSEFCDWYIEMAKIDLYGESIENKRRTQKVLWTVLEQALKLLHPFMPFITEEIWQHIPHEGKSIMVSPWPKYNDEWNFDDTDRMELIMDAVRGIRNIRAEMNVPPGKKAAAIARVSSPEVRSILEDNLDIIYTLAKVSEMELIDESSPIPEKAIYCVIKGAEIYIPMEGLVDLDTEIARLKKEKANLEKEIDRVNKKLSNPGFIEKAPQEVVEKEQQKQKDFIEMLKKVEERLKMMTDLAK